MLGSARNIVMERMKLTVKSTQYQMLEGLFTGGDKGADEIGEHTSELQSPA